MKIVINLYKFNLPPKVKTQWKGTDLGSDSDPLSSWMTLARLPRLADLFSFLCVAHNFICLLHLVLLQGCLDCSDGKESTYNAVDPGLIPGLGRSPGGVHGNPFQCSCLENPHGQRSLVGCSTWCRKESDRTKRLSIAYFMDMDYNLWRQSSI